MLATAGVFGHISAIDTIGIRRREVRTEDFTEKQKRREELGFFSCDIGENPLKKLVDLHLKYIKNRKEIGYFEKLMGYRSVRQILHTTYLKN